MKHYYQIILVFALALSACGQKEVKQEKTLSESPEMQRQKALSQKFVKKWVIKKHYHPGALDQADIAPEGEYLHLKTDGTYEMKMYNYKETGKWKFSTPRPKNYEAMEMDLPLKQEEEVLELFPEKKDFRKERNYVIKINEGKLMAMSTFDPTSIEATAE